MTFKDGSKAVKFKSFVVENRRDGGGIMGYELEALTDLVVPMHPYLCDTESITAVNMLSTETRNISKGDTFCLNCYELDKLFADEDFQCVYGDENIPVNKMGFLDMDGRTGHFTLVIDVNKMERAYVEFVDFCYKNDDDEWVCYEECEPSFGGLLVPSEDVEYASISIGNMEATGVYGVPLSYLMREDCYSGGEHSCDIEFICHVEDARFLDGNGTIKRKIVGYKLKALADIEVPVIPYVSNIDTLIEVDSSQQGVRTIHKGEEFFLNCYEASTLICSEDYLGVFSGSDSFATFAPVSYKVADGCITKQNNAGTGETTSFPVGKVQLGDGLYNVAALVTEEESMLANITSFCKRDESGNWVCISGFEETFGALMIPKE